MSFKDKIKEIIAKPEERSPAFGAAFLLAFTLLFFGPSFIYYGNILEIPYYYSDMVWQFLAYSLVAGVIISVILLLLKGTIHQRAVAFVFAMGLLFWIQGHILVWDYGVLDGRAIIWEDYLLNGIIDSAIWIGVLAITLIKGPVLYKHIAMVSVLLLVVQGVGLAADIYQAPDVPEWKSFSIDYDAETMFEFSHEQNVIILVLDMFQSDLFQEIIDEDPKYREFFDGFTYYRNAVGAHPTTYPSVTSILTGEFYDNSIPILDHIKKLFINNSIPKILKEKGYRVDLFPSNPQSIYFSTKTASNIKVNHSDWDIKGIEDLEELSFFRFFPHFLKQELYNISFKIPEKSYHKNDVAFYNSLKSNISIMNMSKVMKFFHIWGAHSPYGLNAELERESLPNNRSGGKEQAKGSLKIAGELITQLKNHEIYDNSIIFIVGDHGNPWGSAGLNLDPVNTCNNIGYTSKNVLSSGIPLILFKPLNKKGILTISDNPVTLGDIPITIVTELNISTKFPGISFVNNNGSMERERTYYFYTWDNGWDKEYLPKIFEYRIKGHSWCMDSWKKTNRIFNPGGEVITSEPTYELDNTILFGKNGTGEKYQLDGWSHPEKGHTWTDGHRSVLGIKTLKPDSDLNLTVTASPFTSQQLVNVTVNDHLVGEWIFDKPKGQEISIKIPQEILNEGMQYIIFDLPDAKSPLSLGLSKDGRTLGLAIRSIRINTE